MSRMIILLGLRGAVAFSLSTQLQFDAEQRSVLVTSTLIIVLFTILVFGGSTLPLLKVREPITSSLYLSCRPDFTLGHVN